MSTMSSAAPASPAAAGHVVTGNIDLTDQTDQIDQIDHIDTVDEEFYALVYSDPQWLRAEFDAIIAADSWGSTPPSIPSPHGGAERPERGDGLEPSKVTMPRGLGGHTSRGRGARTRSPPGQPSAATRVARTHRSTRSRGPGRSGRDHETPWRYGA